jgi:hypothetical protein
VREYFPAEPPEGWHDSDDDSLELDENPRLPSMADASRSIMKRDEKLRWLFGESVGAALPSRHPSNPRLRRQASHSESSLPLRLSDNDVGMDFIHISLPERTNVNRHLSVSTTSTATSHSRHHPSNSLDDSLSLRRVGSIDSAMLPLFPRPLDHYYDPPSPLPPFSGLLQDEAERSPPVVPPTKNSLTPAAKRDLVKRSRKLQYILGATLDEDAAQRVLRTHTNSDPPPVSPRFDRNEFVDSLDKSPRQIWRSQRTFSCPPDSPSFRTSMYHSPTESLFKDEEDDSEPITPVSFTKPTTSDRAQGSSNAEQAKIREERRRKVS